MVLFLIVTISVLVLTVAGVAISQQVLANRTVQRNDALEAAEAGLDAAVGEIRATNNGSGNGQVESLPCDWPTPGNGFTLTGYLDTSSSASYTDTVTYYGNVQPTPTNISNGTAVPITCYTGASSPSYPNNVPYFALVQAAGQGTSTGPETAPTRTIDEIYAFTDDNVNNPGGVIQDFYASTDFLCLSVSSSDTDITPAANDPIYVDKCLTAGDEDQTWEYLQNFTIELGSTATLATPLCIKGNTTNDTLALAACSTTPLYTMQWGINDSGQYQPVASGGGANGNLCMNEEANAAGSQVNLAACNGGFSATQTWQPTPQVGAGDAGTATQQFVNYEEFGNCMDVTNQDVGSAYLIDYMCKQFPDGATWTSSSGTDPYDPTWNQRFLQYDVSYAGTASPPAQPVLLETHITPGSTPYTTYCLWSPDNITDGTTSPTGNNPSWVTVQPCPSVGTGNVVPTGSTGGYLNQGFIWYVNSNTTYWVQDAWLNCLNADTQDQQQPGGGSYFTTLTVASCNSSASSEEWNAPPSLTPATESHLYEPVVSGN